MNDLIVVLALATPEDPPPKSQKLTVFFLCYLSEKKLGRVLRAESVLSRSFDDRWLMQNDDGFKKEPKLLEGRRTLKFCRSPGRGILLGPAPAT